MPVARLINYLIVCGLVLFVLAPQAVADDRPNVIVIFTDDQGYADLGVQGSVNDIRTPHLDAMAAAGVRFTNGYITAPQCSPSRAGLMTGRYQQRFGIDNIADCPLPLEQVTLAERLQDAGYATGMIGKWHLEPNPITVKWAQENLSPEQFEAMSPKPGRVNLPAEMVHRFYPEHQGFTDVFKGELTRYWLNYDLAGQSFDKPRWREYNAYRLDTQTDAAVQFIDRHGNSDQPFFLYLAYFAPHVPLEADDRYLQRFPGEMPERRRYALAMISAMDDGVGLIRQKLEQVGQLDNTLIVYTSDNGAPLKIDKKDLPISFPGGAWDGSLNDPLNGEKGTLLEGGIRVPMVWSWPGRLPKGAVVDEPVSSLDIAATSAAMAGIDVPEELDGIDLIPHLTGEKPWAERSLYWRFWNQAAVRQGKWKYLHLGSGESFLFDLDADPEESNNLMSEHADKAAELRGDLDRWTRELQPPGLPSDPLNGQERQWMQHYLGVQAK